MADRGRPCLYTPDVAAEILRRLTEGESLRAICKDAHLPAESTVRAWAVEDLNGFAAHYARARDIGLDAMADELLEISDDGSNDWMERNGADSEGWSVNGEALGRSRLRVDTRKWLLSKMAPKKYGDRVALDHGGSINLTHEQWLASLDGAGDPPPAT